MNYPCFKGKKISLKNFSQAKQHNNLGLILNHKGF